MTLLLNSKQKNKQTAHLKNVKCRPVRHLRKKNAVASSFRGARDVKVKRRRSRPKRNPHAQQPFEMKQNKRWHRLFSWLNLVDTCCPFFNYYYSCVNSKTRPLRCLAPSIKTFPQKGSLKMGPFLSRAQTPKSSISHYRRLITGWRRRSSTSGIRFIFCSHTPSKWHSAATVVTSVLHYKLQPVMTSSTRVPSLCACPSLAEYVSSVPLAEADFRVVEPTLIPHSLTWSLQIQNLLRGTLGCSESHHSISTIWRVKVICRKSAGRVQIY